MTTVLLDLKPSQIKPHKANVRRDVGSVDELAASIAEKGLIEPLIVVPLEIDERGTPLPKGKIGYVFEGVGFGPFVLIAGHRRLAAAKQAKCKTVPCIVRADLAQDPKGQIELMLVENLQRTDLTAVEEGEAYQMLLTFPGYTQTRIAEKTGRAIATVRSRLKLTGLPKSALEKVHAGQIPLVQAEALVGFQDEPATFKRLVACAGTDGFARQLDEATRRRKAERAAERLRKKLEAEGVRIIGAPVIYDPNGPRQLFGAKAADEHRDCEGFAAYVSPSPWAGTANVVYVCDKPQLHAGETDDEGGDEPPDRYAEKRELLKEGTAARHAWLRDHVLNDPSDGLGIDLLRQLAHAKAGQGYPRSLEVLADELLGVPAGDKKARAAAIDKLDWRQCAILFDLLDNADTEDALRNPHNWDAGSYTKKWRARLTGLYGYTWSPAEQQVMDELAAEAEAKAAADAEDDVDDLVEGATGDPLTKDQAHERAGWHRGEFGDDVIQHDPEDWGDSFRCGDCDWLVLYVDVDPDTFADAS